MSTFKHGVHPRGEKHLAKDKEIESLSKYSLPAKVFVPLKQFAGESVNLLVGEGDLVKKGQLIASPTGKFGVGIHSSVAGKVVAVNKKLPNSAALYVEIENDFSGEEVKLAPLKNPSSKEIIERIKDAGIIGMGGAAFPTHFKLSIKEGVSVDYLVVNAAECEPYITCDYRIMLEKAKEVIEGVKIVAATVSAKQIIIGVEDNKKDAINSLLSIEGTTSDKKQKDKILIASLKTKYPQGAEKMLVKATTGRSIPPAKLPLDVGCTVVNLNTCYAIYNAVTLGLPLTERVVTISGKAIENPKNLIVPVGTLVADLLEVGKMKEEPREIISGGTMMGESIAKADAFAVSKATSSILFLTKEEINLDPASACINCGGCESVCPMNLMPMYIDGNSLNGDFELAKKYGALNCMECGSCAFVCPAKRPLVQSIKLAKKIIKERGI